ncbi:MAG: zinc ribbon domain-containing protein [Dehalococcoidia bacterium]
MPIYEFVCRHCGKVTSIFTKSVSAPYDAVCRGCGGRSLERAVSRFAYHKSEQTILEEHGAEPQHLEDYKDPRQIGRWVERRFRESGMEVPAEAQRMIEAARQGEFPEPLKDA